MDTGLIVTLLLNNTPRKKSDLGVKAVVALAGSQLGLTPTTTTTTTTTMCLYNVYGVPRSACSQLERKGYALGM